MLWRRHQAVLPEVVGSARDKVLWGGIASCGVRVSHFIHLCLHRRPIFHTTACPWRIGPRAMDEGHDDVFSGPEGERAGVADEPPPHHLMRGRRRAAHVERFVEGPSAAVSVMAVLRSKAHGDGKVVREARRERGSVIGIDVE